MRPSEALKGREQKVRELVFSFGFKNPRVFGSVARGEDDDESDLDILVEYEKDVVGMMYRLELQERVSLLLGVRVDMKTAGGLPEHAVEQIKKESIPL